MIRATHTRTYSAIATDYRHFEFRSRLEAKWAVFFDLCGWQWSYEPMDLDGWIPDFAIGEQPTLVEVKPFFSDEEWKEAIEKIKRTGYDKPVILLGADPTWFAQETYFEAPQCGWLLERLDVPGMPQHIVSDLHFGITEGNERIGLCPMDGGWSNYIWNAPNDRYANKWSRVEMTGSDRETELVERWAKACNVSKWVPTK